MKCKCIERSESEMLNNKCYECGGEILISDIEQVKKEISDLATEMRERLKEIANNYQVQIHVVFNTTKEKTLTRDLYFVESQTNINYGSP